MMQAAGLALAALALAVGGCSPAAEPESVLLLTLDTTRVDALGSYRGRQARTPHLDALARESARYAQAVTTAPYTGPSHASILTGLYPPRHGLRDFLRQSLPESVDTLAEILRRRGYQTAAFVSAYVLDPRYGLDQGFDLYSSPRSPGAGELPSRRRGAETIGEAVRWLADRDPSTPFFLWVHLYDPHSPYLPPRRLWGPVPSGMRMGTLDWQRLMYYREATYSDEQVGRLVQALRGLELWRGLIVAVVADHGELLGEHGRPITWHSPMLVDATVRVPMLLRIPGRLRPGVVPQQVSVVDILPTILDALDIPAPEGTDGRSLLEAPAAARPAYSETFYEHFPERAAEGEELAGLRLDGWKLVVRPGREELYDLRSDAEELVDMSAARPEQLARLRAELDGLRARWSEEGPAAPLELDEREEREHRERLRALGYLQ